VDVGNGPQTIPSLINYWDEQALRNKIAADMPPSSPISCSGLCAQTTTEYIREAFRPVAPVNNQPPTPQQPVALIATEDDLTNFVPHSISFEARYSGIAGSPMVQWFLDDQLVAVGNTYDVDFQLPGRRTLQMVITGQDNEQITVTEEISIMAQDIVVDECSPPMEFYAVRIGPTIVDPDCALCHRDGGQAGATGLRFESLAVRGALTNNYQNVARYARTPSIIIDAASGLGHGGGQRLNLGNANSPLRADLQTFLAIEAETPANCLPQ
jgi:hypothetical protein